MAYKLIALDLDDTLLDSHKNLSGPTRDALARAKNAGLQLVLTSGRAFPGIDAYNKELGIKGYTIACAGAQVVDADGGVVFSAYVPPIAAKQVMRWAALRDIHFQVYFDDGFHYLRHNRFSDFYEKNCGLDGIVTPGLMEMEPILTSKILLIDEPEHVEEYRREISSLFPDLQIQTSQREYLEVLNPEASKATALAFVADKLGLSPRQIVAVGDSEIDVDMLKYAGLGIAVANAVPKALDAADYVTASNDEHGVAKAIDKFLLD